MSISDHLAANTIWNVAEWLDAHAADTGESPYEIFGQKHGYRLTVQRIPLHPAGDDELERLKNGLIALDDHFMGLINQTPRRELHAFLAAYDIPWNNPA